MIEIVLVNQSTRLTAADVAAAAAALQTQVSRDFAPAWSPEVAAAAQVVAGTAVASGQWPIYLPDTDADLPADVLGEHDDSGVPWGVVPIATNIEAGAPWTTSVSHELLEMLADPACNRAVLVSYQGRRGYVALEVCDAVEDDQYAISGVPVSNFCLPPWFLSRGHQSRDRPTLAGRLPRPARRQAADARRRRLPAAGFRRELGADFRPLRAAVEASRACTRVVAAGCRAGVCTRSRVAAEDVHLVTLEECLVFRVLCFAGR